MSITIASTTDSEETVKAAQADVTPKAPNETVAEEKSAADEKSVEIPTESETVENEIEDTEDDEANEGEEEGEEKVKEKEQPKKKGGFKRRIDKLRAQNAAMEKELQGWREKALKSEAPSPAKQSNEVNAGQTLEGKPNPENYKTHAEYTEALTDWKYDQRKKADEVKARETALKSEFDGKVKTHLERLDKFKATKEDFDEVIEGAEDVLMSVTVQQAILDSDYSAELMYELAKNKEDYAKICQMPPLAAAKAIGRIEAGILKASESSKEQTTQKTTKAPKPLTPVQSKTTGTKKTIYDEDISQADFERLRNKQLSQRSF